MYLLHLNLYKIINFLVKKVKKVLTCYTYKLEKKGIEENILI